jgi:chromosome partitioning protein
LAGVGNTYQWCIIDCPPSVGLLTFNALKACDEVVVPVETGYFSLHGLAKMMETLEVMKDRCGRDILIRVLPTLYDTRTKLAREVLSELRAKFRDYLMESTVNFNTKLKEAASFGQPITEYDPGSRGYKDFVNLARELMGHRPVDLEPTPAETLSRPAELVQRAKQLSQLANFQFGRTNMPGANSMVPESKPFIRPEPQIRPEPVRYAATNSRASEMGLDLPEEPLAPHFSSSSTAITAMPMTSTQSTSIAAPITAPTRLKIEPAVEQKITTQQKIEAFYGVKQVDDQIVFAARFEGAKKVLIAGDFNNWSPMSTPMVNGETNGLWITKLPLFPGRYRYRFIVDGRWTTDPANTHVEANQFGELNNVVEVK